MISKSEIVIYIGAVCSSNHGRLSSKVYVITLFNKLLV